MLARSEMARGQARPSMPPRRDLVLHEAARRSGSQLGGGFSAREEAFEAAQTFVDAFDGGGVRKPKVTGRPKGFARHDRDMRLVEQHFGDFRARFCQRRFAGTAREARTNLP